MGVVVGVATYKEIYLGQISSFFRKWGGGANSVPQFEACWSAAHSRLSSEQHMVERMKYPYPGATPFGSP